MLYFLPAQFLGNCLYPVCLKNYHKLSSDDNFLDKDVEWKGGMVGMAPWKRTQTHIIMESVDK